MRIGVDLGGHTITAALVSEPVRGETPKIERVDEAGTPAGRSMEGVMNAIAAAAARLARGAKISSIGVAVPGMLDAGRQRSLMLPNFPPEWSGADIPALLGTVLERKGIETGSIGIENDANCYALGEGFAGEAVGMSDFMTFTLGTGIGCGIVSGGSLLTGAHGMAGEGGHLVVSGDAPCGCGGKGHSETLAAADGTTARSLARGLPGDFRELWTLRGSREADEVIEITLDAMARTIASACHLLDPEAVIIGGGMSRAEGIREALLERAIPYLSAPFKNKLDLRVSRLGSRAALYGAAGLRPRGSKPQTEA